MSDLREAQGTLATALEHAERLLARDPRLAEAQAREILKVSPGHEEATRVLARALRASAEPQAARDALAPVTASLGASALAHYDFGLALADCGDTRAAIKSLKKAVRREPALAAAWLALADQLDLAGDAAGADEARARHLKAATNDPELIGAAAALCENKLAIAERLLRERLKRQPTDIAAIRMLAETGCRLGRYADAELLLKRCLELAPGFTAARHNYATVLHRLGKFEAALSETARLLKDEPRNLGYRSLEAALLGRIGDYARAIAAYEELLAKAPEQPKAWLSFGHALRAVGRQEDAVAAYRKSIALLPSFGEAWFSLANLKTVRFDPDEVEALRRESARSDLDDEDRLHLHFALAKAFEDERNYADSFAHYAKANAIRRGRAYYNSESTSEQVRRAKALFTEEFFRSHDGVGAAAPDPIFIVGLPRAGSTLVEQILSSHSAIEGTMELPDIIAVAQRLGGRPRKDEPSLYPEVLARLPRDEFARLGEDYLARTRVQRRLGRLFFTDKMPNNFFHVGLIALILPNAKIIDARRHPLACCFSAFKQHFARGQNFAYDLEDLGRYYRDYVALMAHFDAVLPGRIYRVIHEHLVQNPEIEIRRLLAYCGVPFEESCLAFHQTDRAVRTASSEQVRQPLSTEGLEQWKHFEPWLRPLKEALGPVLESWPDAPPFTGIP